MAPDSSAGQHCMYHGVAQRPPEKLEPACDREHNVVTECKLGADQSHEQ